MDEAHHELRDVFRSRVSQSFCWARICFHYARTARSDDAHRELALWVERARVLRRAAARWRRRAATLAPVLVCLLSFGLSGCGREPSREFAVDFNVQPSPDGRGVLWSLSFTPAQYHAMLDSTPEGVDINAVVHHKVRELVAAGLESNRLAGCRGEKWVVATLADGGIAFLGTCPVVAYAVPAGGI
jgi:hypothetical protein